jgi:hypothetical protein
LADIAEMIMEGLLCEVCGGIVDEESTGYPRSCEDCENE